MKLCGIICLTVRIGKFRARVPFLRQNLAVDYLIRSSFVDHHVNTILPGLRKDVFYHNPSVSITAQCSLAKPKTSFTLELENLSQKFRTAWNFTIPPISQASVQTQCMAGETSFAQNTPRLVIKHLALLANGIMDNFSRKPFQGRLFKFFSCAARLLKNTVIRHALKVPRQILTVNALRHRLLQTKEERRIAKNSDISDKNSSQKPGRGPEE